MKPKGRRYMIQSATDKILNNLRIEDPDLNIEITYTNKRLTSTYIYIDLDDVQFIIRVSDHESYATTFDYGVLLVIGREFKLCSTVMDILTKIKEKKNRGETNEKK